MLIISLLISLNDDSIPLQSWNFKEQEEYIESNHKKSKIKMKTKIFAFDFNGMLRRINMCFISLLLLIPCVYYEKKGNKKHTQL